VTLTEFRFGGSMSSTSKPDFSGEWILNREACSLSPGADAMRSGSARIDHHEPTFRYEATFTSDGDPAHVAYELLSDGREVVNKGEGMTIVSCLRWEGEALIASWQIQRPDGEMTISFRHELIDKGRRLRAVEVLRGTGRHQDNVWIFDRS
jgi:hypothetical protein